MATLAGYAGCGKSWLVAQLGLEWQRQGVRVAYVAPTGKAALVACHFLSRAGIDAISQTIHGAFLRPIDDEPVFDEDGNRVDEVKPKTSDLAWAPRENPETEPWLIVVDEASMLTMDVLRAAQATCPTSRFLFVGDHFQLPAIGASAGVMLTPDWRLETVMRQALGSPIVEAAHLIRTESISAMLAFARQFSGKAGGDSPLLVVSERMDAGGVSGMIRWTYEGGWDDGMVVVARNATRMRVNGVARGVLRGVNDDDLKPQVGDTMVCEMNCPAFGVVNGERFRVDAVEESAPGYLSILPRSRTHLETIDLVDRKDYHEYVRAARAAAKRLVKHGLDPDNDHFASSHRDLSVSHGYALTCHKAQGSQARRVVVALGDMTWGSTEERRRWAYTAMTRATDSVRLVGNL